MVSFAQYPNSAAYQTARDQLTAQFENAGLFANNPGSGLFYYDAAGLNIGFGFNITGHLRFIGGVVTTASSAATRAQLSGVSLTFTDAQWDAVVAEAHSPSATSGQATSLNG